MNHDESESKIEDKAWTRRTLLAVTGGSLTTLAGYVGEEPASRTSSRTDQHVTTAAAVENDEDDEEVPYVDEEDEQVVLAYGESAHHSNGIIVTADEFHFEDRLGRFTVADDGEQFALLELTGENTGEEAERLPSRRDFVLLHDGSQYDSTFFSDPDEYEEFEGGEIMPDVTREGVVVFEVPNGLTQAELDALWYDDSFDSNIDVRWTETAEDEPLERDDDGQEAEDEDRQYVDEADEQVVLAYGDRAYHSSGVQITANDLYFESRLGDLTVADDGEQFALLDLTGENTAESAERLPLPWTDFALLHTGDQYDPSVVSGLDEYEEFEGGEIMPDVTREGVVAFEVPADLTRADLDTVWYDDFLDANINVLWTDN